MYMHITYHPLDEALMQRYVAFLSPGDGAEHAAAHCKDTGVDDATTERLLQARASFAQADGSPFDQGHGLNIAVLQGLLGQFHYVHNGSLSALGDVLDRYTTPWQDALPDWSETKTANNQLTGPQSSGAYLSPDQVVAFMTDAQKDPELRSALAAEFPGQQLHLLWAALQDAHQARRGVLEVVGIIKPDLNDLAASICATDLNNCASAGLEAYQAFELAAPALPPEPDTLGGLPAAPTAADLAQLPPPPATAPTATDLAQLPPPPATAPTEFVVAAEPAATAEQWFDYAVAVAATPFDAQQHLAATFAASRGERGAPGALAFAVHVHEIGLWLDWQKGHDLQQMCRELVDHRIGWSDEAFPHMHEIQFTWQSSGADVHLGLVAFDGWLKQHGHGYRLVSIATGGEFLLSILHPEATAATLISALAGCGLQAALQDGSQPDPNRATLPPPPAGSARPASLPGSLPDEPPIPHAGTRLPTTKSLTERLREKREEQG